MWNQSDIQPNNFFEIIVKTIKQTIFCTNKYPAYSKRYITKQFTCRDIWVTKKNHQCNKTWEKTEHNQNIQQFYFQQCFINRWYFIFVVQPSYYSPNALKCYVIHSQHMSKKQGTNTYKSFLLVILSEDNRHLWQSYQQCINLAKQNNVWKFWYSDRALITNDIPRNVIKLQILLDTISSII